MTESRDGLSEQDTAQVSNFYGCNRHVTSAALVHVLEQIVQSRAVPVSVSSLWPRPPQTKLCPSLTLPRSLFYIHPV